MVEKPTSRHRDHYHLEVNVALVPGNTLLTDPLKKGANWPSCSHGISSV